MTGFTVMHMFFEIIFCTVLLYLYNLVIIFTLYIEYSVCLFQLMGALGREGLEFRLAADTPTRYYNTGINPKWVMG